MRKLASALARRKPAMASVPLGVQRARVESVPAPTGGWNTRDPISDMDEKDAPILDNWWPTPTFVKARKGFEHYTTGLPDAVETLMPYNNPTNPALFAACNNAFYSVAGGGAVGAAVQSGLLSSQWDFAQFLNSSGIYYLCCFTGSEAPRYWDGTSWTTVTAVSTPGITGVSPNVLKAPVVFKRRMFLIERDTLNIWYLPVDAVGGAASKLSLTGIAHNGGELVALGTWTLDAGEGLDDHLVAITSEGEVIVYKGTDPSSSTAWFLVGVWKLGTPLGGSRCLTQIAGDLLYLSCDGVFPLSAALQAERTNMRVALSDKISSAINDACRDYSGNDFWGIEFIPKLQMLLVNVPVTPTGANALFYQYVMNTQNKSWARFTGVPARCWAIYQDAVYFGGDTIVGRFWNVDYDTASDGSQANIQTDVQQAFSYFRQRGRIKKFNLARPVFIASGNVSVACTVNVDYDVDAPVSQVIAQGDFTAGLWDSGLWDSAIWGGGVQPLRPWQTISGNVGTCAALRMSTSQKNITLEWPATDWVLEVGGPLG